MSCGMRESCPKFNRENHTAGIIIPQGFAKWRLRCAPPGDYRSLGGPPGTEISGALEGRKCALARFQPMPVSFSTARALGALPHPTPNERIRQKNVERLVRH